MCFSWIIPARNEAQSLPTLLSEIVAVMSGRRFEIIVVNDGSTDHTAGALSRLKRTMPALRSIAFLRPMGKWEALRSGISESRGDVIITIDGDLQDNPEESAKLLKKLRQGYDLVSSWRTARKDPWYKVAISRLGNAVISIATRHRFHDLNSPFKVFRRRVLLDLPREGSLLRFSLLFAYKMGYRAAEIPIRHRPRRYGHSKFGVMKYLRILCDLVLVLLLFSGSGRIRNHVRIGRS